MSRLKMIYFDLLFLQPAIAAGFNSDLPDKPHYKITIISKINNLFALYNALNYKIYFAIFIHTIDKAG